jgi:hypothetical protein
MLASRTCEVQMFELAFSRRMCCSRVCSAMRSAVLPRASTETPMMRPAIERLYSSRVAKKGGVRAAETERDAEALRRTEGDVGTHFARRASSTRAIRSEATATTPPRDLTAAIGPLRSLTSPRRSGTETAPRRLPVAPPRPAAEDQFEAEEAARVCSTSMVCGKQAASTKKRFDFDLLTRRAMLIASAAAVASSSRRRWRVRGR